MKLNTYTFIFKIAAAAFFLMLLPGMGLAKNVTLPIAIEYSLLRSIAVSQLFSGSENGIEILNDPKECKKIVISDLNFSEENSRLKFEIKVHITAGFDLFNDCRFPIKWEGYVSFFQTPEIGADNWQLSFNTQDSFVQDKAHRSGFISSAVWKLIKGNVHAYVNAIQIDLSPCVNEMKAFISEIFPEKLQPGVDSMIASMKPGRIEIQDKIVQIGVQTDVSAVYDDTRVMREDILDEKALEEFIRTWESMDAFIVYMFNSLARRPFTDAEKDVILETLLDTRYRFVAELDRSVHENDFVRNQFIHAWDRVAVILTQHIGKNKETSPLGGLAFLSSMQALKVLDSIGPTMGIEISWNGLMRLARLLADKKTPDLFYSLKMDSELRHVLGFNPQFIETIEPADENQIPENQDFLDTVLNRLLSLLPPVSEAMAAEQKNTGSHELEKWLPSRPDTAEYIRKIRGVLKTAARQTAVKNKRAPENHALFNRIVNAVAWQESCLRQFKLNNGEIDYLRSYNNSSVGVMQINERVWRGIYDQEKLRWKIHYNIQAGCEIVDLYLNRYILKKKTGKDTIPGLEDADKMARALYAVYNGGPADFSKFLDRQAKNKFYISDDLFYEKYLWVKNNQWENVAVCLAGR